MPRSETLPITLITVTLLVVFLVVGSHVLAGEKKRVDHQRVFTVYTQKCLGSHDSVADPEKPGRTRDGWHLVVNIMNGYGLGLTDQETELITDLLYDLRWGIEGEPG